MTCFSGPIIALFGPGLPLHFTQWPVRPFVLFLPLDCQPLLISPVVCCDPFLFSPPFLLGCAPHFLFRRVFPFLLFSLSPLLSYNSRPHKLNGRCLLLRGQIPPVLPSLVSQLPWDR